NVSREMEHESRENVLDAASERSSDRALGGCRGTRQAEFAIEARRKYSGAIEPGRKVLAIHNRQILCAPREDLSERLAKLRLAIFAEPLELVLVALRAKPCEWRNPEIKPAERIRKRERVERFDVVILAERDQSRSCACSVIQSENERA